MLALRDVVDADHEALVALAAACGQVGMRSAQDPSYVAAIAGHGRFVVADDDGALLGFAGALDRGAVSYLTDLFVRPDAQRRGVGAALLDAVWAGTAERATSSSLHPAALGSYLRWGLAPSWPLLYLDLDGTDDTMPPQATRSRAEPAEAGWIVPGDDVSVLDLGSGARAVLAHDGDDVEVLRADVATAAHVELLVRACRALAGSGGTVHLHVPGTHPGLRVVVALGGVVVDTDLWCATPGAADLCDPHATFPSPALG